MDCVLNGRKMKYEDGKIWLWRETLRNQTLKNPYWWELKGCVDKSKGYRRVTINNKNYRFHRLVYFLHNDDWDIHDSSMDNSIDHIDRDRLNNNIENLRVVTNQQNTFNRDAKGFSFHKGKYEARIVVDGKTKYLGYFMTAEEAGAAYLDAKGSLHHISP